MKTSLDQLDKIVKNKKYNTTVSYCQGCIDCVILIVLTDAGPNLQRRQRIPNRLSWSVESQTEESTADTCFARYTKISYTLIILPVRKSRLYC